jgi:hypothetical protein
MRWPPHLPMNRHIFLCGTTSSHELHILLKHTTSYHEEPHLPMRHEILTRPFHIFSLATHSSDEAHNFVPEGISSYDETPHLPMRHHILAWDTVQHFPMSATYYLEAPHLPIKHRFFPGAQGLIGTTNLTTISHFRISRSFFRWGTQFRPRRHIILWWGTISSYLHSMKWYEPPHILMGNLISSNDKAPYLLIFTPWNVMNLHIDSWAIRSN